MSLRFWINAIFSGSLIFLLTACSPHPGSGHWQADSENSLKVKQIKVTFEGTADIFATGKEESIFRCFWAAHGEHTMQLECVYADNTDKHETFQLVVSPTDRNKAELKLGEQSIVHLSRQAYEPETKEKEKKKDLQP